MAFRIKAGTSFSLPIIIDDDNFELISEIEFMFKQEEDDDDGAALKTALWSRDGESRDCTKKADENLIYIKFRREDTYLFEQGEDFFMDTRIHYAGTDENPYTNIVRFRMNNTLFESGEEATENG